MWNHQYFFFLLRTCEWDRFTNGQLDWYLNVTLTLNHQMLSFSCLESVNVTSLHGQLDWYKAYIKSPIFCFSWTEPVNGTSFLTVDGVTQVLLHSVNWRTTICFIWRVNPTLSNKDRCGERSWRVYKMSMKSSVVTYRVRRTDMDTR